MREIIRTQFDKLLLTALLATLCLMAVHGYHAGQPGMAGFATDQARTVIGALLGLITGHALGSAAAGKATPTLPEEPIHAPK